MNATLGCKDIGIRKSEFVATTQFLLEKIPRLDWRPEFLES